MAKATTTIRQGLNYSEHHAAWFAATATLFNQIAAFYFEVIGAHEGVLALSNQEALTALETLTHTTKKHPTPVMPLSALASDVPALFRRAAIHAALGSARSFYTHLSKWRTRKQKAQAKGKKWTERPPVPPRTWNQSTTLYAGQRHGNTNGHGTAQETASRDGRSVSDMPHPLRSSPRSNHVASPPTTDDVGVSEATGL